ncbi:unnamed protein product [Allacma fusca]|uniref:Uncharacterized protein n=1 Tax=Allacma fusca TaxID=39272 RepID=A0A8J2LB88_9HEXA|nr:unnamed protein product [Allacma fusca]
MNNTTLQDLQGRLEDYGFPRFIQDHFDYLHTNTLRHERLGKELVALGVIDEGERKMCMEKCGNRDRNIQFYNLLVAREAHWELLLALFFSNNNFVLQYIGEKLGKIFQPIGRYASTSFHYLVHPRPSTQFEAITSKINPDSSLFYWNAIIEENVFSEVDDKKK